MSWNPIKSIICCLVASTALSTAATEVPADTEDTLIIKALLDEEAGKLSESKVLYETLYALTGKKEYLLQEAKDTLLQKSDPGHSIDNLVQWITAHPENRDVALYRMLVALYIQQGSLVDAENVADAYLSVGTPAEDQMAVAALKLELKKPDEAAALFRKAYLQKEDEKILLQLGMVLEKNLHHPQEAILLLDKHIKAHKDSSIGIYFKLIELYAKEKNLEKVEELYKKLYKKDPQKYFLQKIIEISLYRNDIDGVIAFLEQNRGNEEILFTFYKEKKKYEKAIDIAKKLYKTTQNVKWLAEQGMLVYERAKQSRAIDPKALKKMQRLLEEALKKGLNDALYLNYYGYTLIDHDLDIDRGISLVKRALEQEPANTYYLDSLAWGLYKSGQCDKAYEIMKQVVAKEGLGEEEIKTHWDLTRKCYLK